MRKLITAAFVSLDGVMQAPGGPEEDTTGGFRYGGWVAPHSHPVTGEGTAENFGRPYDLVLGRRTHDIFAAYWPRVHVDPAAGEFEAGMAEIANAFNSATKYVASRSRRTFDWQNSQWLGGDPAAAIRALKQGDGPDLLTQGSSDFVQTLLAEDLIDELRLLDFPLTLGTGKQLFGSGTIAAGFSLRLHAHLADGGHRRHVRARGRRQDGVVRAVTRVSARTARRPVVVRRMASPTAGSQRFAPDESHRGSPCRISNVTSPIASAGSAPRCSAPTTASSRRRRCWSASRRRVLTATR